MSTFELFLDKAKQFRFRLKAANGEPIAASEGYTTKASAKNGIASVRRNAVQDGRYERKQTKAGWSFNLRAGNHQVVATSEVYTTESAREKGIAAVKRDAPKAKVVDLTA